MPFEKRIDPVKSGPNDVINNNIAALEREEAKLTAMRDNSIAQATNPQEAERVRVALQKEVDKVAAQIAAERAKLQEE